MVDVLFALLLLAVVLTGTCATLIQAMRATHAALLTTRAVDLAADLAEELRGVSAASQLEPLVSAWRERVSASLPVTGMSPDEYGALVAVPPGAHGAPEQAVRHRVRLRWRDAVDGTVRELALPVAIQSVE